VAVAVVMSMTVCVPGLVSLAGLVNLAGLVSLAGLVNLAGLVSLPSVPPARLRISHGIQDARKIRLQHLDNSHPHAAAKDPQQARRGLGTSWSRSISDLPRRERPLSPTR